MKYWQEAPREGVNPSLPIRLLFIEYRFLSKKRRMTALYLGD
jgi:hypothetical protein